MKKPTLETAQVRIHPITRQIEVIWTNDHSSFYHYVWLRHSARCPSGLPNDTSIKIDLLPDDPSQLQIQEVKIRNESLLIHWKDLDKLTTHSLYTLKESAYDSLSRKQRKQKISLWHVNNSQNIPVFDFQSLQDSQKFLQICLSVRDYGLAKLKGVPVVPGSIASVAERFGPIHVNNYGRIFDVKTETNVSLGSNTGTYLGPHTDESYRHSPPGISFFHCLKASSSGGGESILVDGFHAVEKLKKVDYDSFKILTRIPLLFQRLALPDEDMQAHGRVIVTDVDGDISGIRFTDRTLPPQDIPEEHVESVYKAIKLFWKVINSDELKYVYSMQPGDLHIFDNQRVLHGRTAFDPTKNQRHLQQCSVNRDEFHNTLRTLASEFKNMTEDLNMTGGTTG